MNAPDRRIGRLPIEAAALGLAAAAGLAAWAVGVSHRAFNYDEVLRAHSVWLAGQGLRPYDDFFELHPPYFALLAPLIRRFADPCHALLALRALCAVANLAFLASLVALAARGPVPRRWAWLAVVGVAAHPKILDFLIEFRADALGYAVASAAFLRYLRRGSDGWAAPFELGVVGGLATLVFCPKLTVLPVFLVVADRVLNRASARSLLRAALATAAGLGVAACLFGLYVAANGITLGRAYPMLISYHSRQNGQSTFGYGLLRAILENRALIAAVAAGSAVWLVGVTRRAWSPSPYDAALVAWLGVQVVAVSYPHSQYSAPWFLFATSLMAYGALPLGAMPRAAEATAYVAVCAVVIAMAAWTGLAWQTRGGLAEQAEAIRLLLRVTPPGERVIAVPPCHPVFRRDTFFVWFNAYDPSGRDTEGILAAIPAARGLVSADRYREELTSHPPAVVALGADASQFPYPEGQVLALGEFLKARGYRFRRLGHLRVAVRPDLAASP